MNELRNTGIEYLRIIDIEIFIAARNEQSGRITKLSIN